jgi:hypothetical protein
MEEKDEIILKEIISENGKKASPKLPEGIKNYIIDIDGVVSEDIPNEESWRMPDAKAIPGAKEQINKWYDEGHIITFFTARTEEHRNVTEEWLKSHDFHYSKVIFGKPRGGNYHYIDDRHVRASTFPSGQPWTKLVKKSLEIEVFE